MTRGFLSSQFSEDTAAVEMSDYAGRSMEFSTSEATCFMECLAPGRHRASTAYESGLVASKSSGERVCRSKRMFISYH